MTEQDRGVSRSELAVRLMEGFRKGGNVVELEFDEVQTAELMRMVVQKGLEREKMIEAGVVGLSVVMDPSEETHDKGIVKGMVNVQKPVEAKEVPVMLFLGNDEQSPGKLKLIDLRVNGRWGPALKMTGGEKKVRESLEDINGLMDEVLRDQLEGEGIVYTGSEKKFEKGKFHLKVGKLEAGVGDATPQPKVVLEARPQAVEDGGEEKLYEVRQTIRAEAVAVPPTPPGAPRSGSPAGEQEVDFVDKLRSQFAGGAGGAGGERGGGAPPVTPEEPFDTEALLNAARRSRGSGESGSEEEKKAEGVRGEWEKLKKQWRSASLGEKAALAASLGLAVLHVADEAAEFIQAFRRTRPVTGGLIERMGKMFRRGRGGETSSGGPSQEEVLVAEEEKDKPQSWLVPGLLRPNWRKIEDELEGFLGEDPEKLTEEGRNKRKKQEKDWMKWKRRIWAAAERDGYLHPAAVLDKQIGEVPRGQRAASEVVRAWRDVKDLVGQVSSIGWEATAIGAYPEKYHAGYRKAYGSDVRGSGLLAERKNTLERYISLRQMEADGEEGSERYKVLKREQGLLGVGIIPPDMKSIGDELVEGVRKGRIKRSQYLGENGGERGVPAGAREAAPAGAVASGAAVEGGRHGVGEGGAGSTGLTAEGQFYYFAVQNKTTPEELAALKLMTPDQLKAWLSGRINERDTAVKPEDVETALKYGLDFIAAVRKGERISAEGGRLLSDELNETWGDRERFDATFRTFELASKGDLAAACEEGQKGNLTWLMREFYSGESGVKRLTRLWRKTFPVMLAMEKSRDRVQEYLDSSSTGSDNSVLREIATELNIPVTEVEFGVKVWRLFGFQAKWDAFLGTKKEGMRSWSGIRRYNKEDETLAIIMNFQRQAKKYHIGGRDVLWNAVNTEFGDVFDYMASDGKLTELGLGRNGSFKTGLLSEGNVSKLGSLDFQEWDKDGMIMPGWLSAAKHAHNTTKILTKWLDKPSEETVLELRRSGFLYLFTNPWGKMHEGDPAQVLKDIGVDKRGVVPKEFDDDNRKWLAYYAVAKMTYDLMTGRFTPRKYWKSTGVIIDPEKQLALARKLFLGDRPTGEDLVLGEKMVKLSGASELAAGGGEALGILGNLISSALKAGGMLK